MVDEKMITVDVLSEASRVVDGNRRNDYGTPLENHARTARFWSAYLGKALLPEDVCMLNILQKISRGMHTVTHDTLVDIAGYARNIQIIKQEKAGERAPEDYAARKDPLLNTGRADGPNKVPDEGRRDNAKAMRDMSRIF